MGERMIQKTPYVDIETLHNGDEKRYWFKVPKGMSEKEASKRAQEIMDKDMESLGRDPRHYDILIGRNDHGLTMRAIYNYERANHNITSANEIERFRNWKEVKKILNTV